MQDQVTLALDLKRTFWNQDTGFTIKEFLKHSRESMNLLIF